MSHFILFFHIALVSGLTLLALRFGKEAISAWLGVLAVAMNLFVLKQITLFGLHVTASDALSVGYLLGLNLIQEFFGSKQARKAIWISLFIAAAFVLLTQIHLLYPPNTNDTTQLHFSTLFQPMPRLICASLFSFLVAQWIDLIAFSFFKEKFKGAFFPLRTLMTLFLSQICDTLLFTFLGLYGLVASLSDVIIFSLCIKAVVILCSTPFAVLSKKVMPSHV